MLQTEKTMTTEEQALLTAVRDGDQTAFGAIANRYRAELRVHCYSLPSPLAPSERAGARG